MRVHSNVEPYMESTSTPGRNVRAVMLATYDGDGPGHWFREFDPPLVEPGTCQCVICTLEPSLLQAPVNEGATPRGFITTCRTIVESSGTVVFEDACIVTLPFDLRSAQFFFRYD